MTDYHKALAAARDALDNHDYGHEIPAYVVRDLLAALDAARGQAVAYRFWDYEEDRWQWGEAAYAEKDDELLYAAPPAADESLADTQRAIIEAAERRGYERGLKDAPPASPIPPERDWTMIQSGDASIPAWVVHYANAIGAYMKAQNVQHWAVGPVQSRNEAKQPAAAVPDDAIEAAYWDFDARHKGYGPHKTTPQSERDAFKWAVRALLAAAARKGE